jgi:membrane protein DedA with SNARE-associated domain
MRWWSFAFWHTLAAFAFTFGFGLGAYFAGEAAIELVERWGAYALVPLGAAAALSAAFVLRRRRRGALLEA